MYIYDYAFCLFRPLHLIRAQAVQTNTGKERFENIGARRARGRRQRDAIGARGGHGEGTMGVPQGREDDARKARWGRDEEVMSVQKLRRDKARDTSPSQLVSNL